MGQIKEQQLQDLDRLNSEYDVGSWDANGSPVAIYTSEENSGKWPWGYGVDTPSSSQDSDNNNDWYYYEAPRCSHEWKLYVGLVDSYEYCTKCDIKKDDLKK